MSGGGTSKPEPSAMERARAHVGDVDATQAIHRLVNRIEAEDTDLSPRPWRVGSSGRTVWSAQDTLIGVLDRPRDTEAVVDAINERYP